MRKGRIGVEPDPAEGAAAGKAWTVGRAQRREPALPSIEARLARRTASVLPQSLLTKEMNRTS